jgi:ABC-type amino acid transport substrate-binding protein
MIKNRQYIATWLSLVLAISALLYSMTNSKETELMPKNHFVSVMDRVQKTREIKCGYVTYAPYLQKNLQTGKLEGPIYDLIEDLGKTLNVKINWAEESDWDTMLQSIESKRFDALCSLAWMDTRRSMSAQFSVPVLYNFLFGYVRYDDKRFDNIQHINSPAITISVLDGSPDQRIAEDRFPNAKIISAPSAGHVSKILLDVVTKKADIAFSEPSVVKDFLKHNPETLKQVGSKPVQIFPLVMILPKGDVDFKSFIDAGFTDLINRGMIEDIFSRYPEIVLNILPVAPPYQLSRLSISEP